MGTQTITLTEFKQNLGEIVNRAAYGKERIVLSARGKAKAVLISLDDLRRLEALEQAQSQQVYVQRQKALLTEARALRERMIAAGEHTDSTAALDEVREERSDELAGLR